MYAVFLSYTQLKEYLSLLLESGLLEFTAVDRTYRTTVKGIDYLHSYEKMNMLSGAERAT
jgi:predicted transcriptional regulator